MREITHKFDEAIGCLVQVVPPEKLRQILDSEGEDYSRPDYFSDFDEWDTGEDDES
jgi:hypothetical protein